MGPLIVGGVMFIALLYNFRNKHMYNGKEPY